MNEDMHTVAPPRDPRPNFSKPYSEYDRMVILAKRKNVQTMAENLYTTIMKDFRLDEATVEAITKSKSNMDLVATFTIEMAKAFYDQLDDEITAVE